MKPLGSSDDLTDEGRIRRLAILGEVLADVAHEINNLMMAISGYAQLEELAQGKDASSNIKDIVRCASQVGCLTTDLLYFARLPEPGARGDVAEAIYRTLRVCGRKVKSAGSPSVSVDVSDELRSVALPTGDVGLVLMNVLRNAFDAVAGQRSSCISITASERSDGVSVSIWNSGPPIRESLMRKLFTPFSSTKPPGQGTGLGLSIAYRLISRVGGDLNVENCPGGGVSFVCTFPFSQQQGRASADRLSGKTPSLLGRRVLIVDDDDRARDVLALMVGHFGGAHADACSSGEEALGILKDQEFDVLVVDLRMPGISGSDLYGLLPANTKKRVVFVTGDTLGVATKKFLASTRQPTLFKPVQQILLLETIGNIAGMP